MDAVSVDHKDDSTPPLGGPFHALFDQPAESLRVLSRSADADDLTCPPIHGGKFVSLGRMHSRGADATLHSPYSPHSGQRGKEAQLSLVFNVEVETSRWMP